MFDDPMLTGMAMGTARQLGHEKRALQRGMQQANANMAEAQAIIDDQHAEILRLRAHIETMAKVRDAEQEALLAERAAWRKEHNVSHMHDFVDKWSDGEGMRRNARIWMDAFYAAARNRGIRNPEEWRKS